MEVEAFGHAFVALKWQICKPKLWSYVFEINIPTRRTRNSHIYLIKKKRGKRKNSYIAPINFRCILK